MGGLIHRGKFMLGFAWTYTQREVYVIGFGWAYTQREVCVRFWVDLHTEGS